MRILLLSLISLLAFTISNAQVCTPDTSYIQAGPGLYPLPDNTMGQDTTLGINKLAYSNCSYDFTFTLVVPDSIDLGTQTVSIDSIILQNIAFRDTAGVVVTTGAENYGCDTADCIWRLETSGCIKIGGLITAPPGQYYATINTQAFSSDFPVAINLEFPNTIFAQGEYVLTVLPNNCPVNVEQVVSNFSSIKASPNPLSDYTTISFESKENLSTEFSVYNLLGKQLYNSQLEVLQGENSVEFQGAQFPAGVYVYSIGHGIDRITERLVISK